MDFDDIVRAARAAREFTHAVDGGRVVATLRVPTPHEAEVAAVRHVHGVDGKRNGAAMVLAQRDLLEQALVGWQGVLPSDILPPEALADATPEQRAESVPHAAALVPLLLDAQPGWAREWWEQVLQRIEARNKLRDTAAKNSARASTGRSPAPRRKS